ncbi:MAG: bifunctional adenosylcobinamide kinase/adenosylcobinamide-phosphate guanylyltransferase [Actinobacteria bacterium]|nr:bifunctional adenosylcobinamide kinase/adenosylcobinamide-phosphate guanylyltransferase [Actinomycetota bacterium]
MSFTCLLGGARSGKSALAVKLAASRDAPVVVIATAEARDDEMSARIREHREARPAAWSTVEAPVGLLNAVKNVLEERFVLLDCLTLWVSNALEAGTTEEQVGEEASELAALLADRPVGSVVVSNEVGLGIVPMNELARSYRDLLGRVNGVFAARADRVYFVVAGRGIPLGEVGLG